MVGPEVASNETGGIRRGGGTQGPPACRVDADRRGRVLHCRSLRATGRGGVFSAFGRRAGHCYCTGSLPGMDGAARHAIAGGGVNRSEEHTSELQSLMRISFAVFFLKKNTIM